MKVLVIDVGGNSVKVLITGESEPRKFPSGPTLTPRQMVAATLKLTEDWRYGAVSVGYPGLVRDNQVVAEPVNLGHGWVHFDIASAFGRPVKVINDAAMQALGSYRTGKLLFLGLGTGLGSALIVDGRILSWNGSSPVRTAPTILRQAERTQAPGTVMALRPSRPPSSPPSKSTALSLARQCRQGQAAARRRASDNALAFRGGFLLWEDGRGKTSAARRESGHREELIANAHTDPISRLGARRITYPVADLRPASGACRRALSFHVQGMKPWLEEARRRRHKVAGPRARCSSIPPGWRAGS